MADLSSMEPLQPMRFSVPVEEAIAKVFPSSDPMDSIDFDPIDYINEHFPDEGALQGLDSFIARLTQQQKRVEREIHEAVRAQSTAGRATSRDIADAKAAIAQLFQKIKDIKSKAEQSELMVQEICADIKQLDYAKEHLTETIVSLRKLHMLVTAVETMERVGESRRFREAGELLKAVAQLLEHFDDYTDIPTLADLRARVEGARRKVVAVVFDLFTAAGTVRVSAMGEDNASGDGNGDDDNGNGGDEEEEEDIAATPQQLREACACVEAMGGGMRRDLMRQFCAAQLKDYDDTFAPGSEAAELGNTERRFAWFRRQLREYNDSWSDVFPLSWGVDHMLCVVFAEKTNAGLHTVLSAIDPPESADVQLLLRALKKTLAFEAEFSARFERAPTRAVSDDAAAAAAASAAGGGGPLDDSVLRDEEGNVVDPESAAGIRVKYARMRVREEREKALQAQQQLAESEQKAAGGDGDGDDGVLPPLKGSMSTAFEFYLIAYVALERTNLASMLDKAVEESSVDRDGALPVLNCSINVFMYIKSSVKRCIALTTGQPFFNLYKEFKACFIRFADLLAAKFPTDAKPLTPEQFSELCMAINTCEYCADTLPALEDMIRAKIDPAFAEHISFEDESDRFYSSISRGVAACVAGVEAALKPSLTAMARLPWATVESVGDVSPFVLTARDTLRSLVPVAHSVLSSLYFRNLCDKLATSFLPKYTANIYSCKRVGEMGAQQLLLDTHALKTIFLGLPDLTEEGAAAAAASGGSNSSSTFTKFVLRAISKTESLLKLLATPGARLADSFPLLLPDAQPAELAAIMELKGMRRVDQQGVLDAMGAGAQLPPRKTVSSFFRALGDEISDISFKK